MYIFLFSGTAVHIFILEKCTLNLKYYSFGKSRVGLKQIELSRLSVLFEANCINKAVPNS